MTTANIYLSSDPTSPDLVLSPHSQPCSEESAKTSVKVVQEQSENTVTEVKEEDVKMKSQNTIELECTVPGCTYTMTITPPFFTTAQTYLDTHWRETTQV